MTKPGSAPSDFPVRPPRWIAAGGFVFVLFILLAKFPPFAVRSMDSDLDSSWVQASVYALLNQLSFGRDFVFTMGPLSPLYTMIYSDGFTLVFIVLRLLTLAFVAYGLVQLTAPSWARFDPAGFLIATAFLVALIFLHGADGIVLLPPIVAALLYVDRGGGTLSVMAGISLSAALGLAKFSVFPVSVAAFLLVDMLSALRREVPYKTAFFLACTAFWFKWSGQALGDLPAFVISSLEISSGYAAAMSIVGPIGELVAWLLLAMLSGVVICVGEWRKVKSGQSDLASSAARVLLFALYLFIAFKAAFIRHDLHSLVGWGALALAAIAFQTPVRSDVSPTRFPMPMLAFIAVAASMGGSYAVATAFKSYTPFNPLGTLRTSWAQVIEGARLLTSPEAWLREKSEQSQAAARRIVASTGLPALGGSIDTIPSRQADLIAAGLKYHPRPTVQEYAAYSEKLIARNRAFFEGASAPEYLIFEPGSIDNRHPASAEGSLWPLLLERYQSVGLSGSALILRKRESPLPALLGAPQSTKIAPGSWFSLPRYSEPVFVRIDIRPRLLAKLIEFVFRPPFVHMSLRYGDGVEEQFRLIPDQARAGMILSPKVASALDYYLIERPDSAVQTTTLRPTALRIDLGALGRLAYSNEVSLSTQRVNQDILRKAALPDDIGVSPSIVSVLPLLRANRMNPPGIRLTNLGILAHAPNTLRLQTGAASELELSFGMQPADYRTFPEFDGACFSVSAEGDTRPIFEKCLNPKQNAADAERQTATIQVPPGTALALRTACLGNCSYDWSYWGGVRLK